MAYRRRITSRRTVRRRRIGRPRIRRRVIGRALRSRNTVHSFSRSQEIGLIQTTSGIATLGKYTFNMGNMTNYSEFTNLFQRFRIVAIKLSIVPVWTENNLVPGTSFSMPNVHSVVDYDDSTTPGDLNELLQYSNYKRTRGHMVHSRYFKPAIQMAAYETTLATAYVPKWKQWLSTDDFATPHYGLKYYIDAIGAVVSFRVYAKYYFQCKDLK